MSTVTTQPEATKAAQKDESSYGLRFFLGGILATTLLVGGGVLIATTSQQRAQHRAAHASLQEAIAQGVLIVHRMDGALDQPDPFSPTWDDAPVRVVELKPQNLAMPAVDDVSVAEVHVQALTDGERIAFRLSWADETVDWNVDAARFTDAAAIQMPFDSNASFMMGNQQSPVQIIHWKALWQKDIDEHFQDVQDVHPNYWADLYWFAEPTDTPRNAGTPYRVPESFEHPASLQWFTAQQAQNPVAQFHREQPVEELLAEGFGSLVTQRQLDSRGRGVWRDGRWHVVFMRPLQTSDHEDVQLHPHSGALSQVGIAIWNGSAQNAGGRKQYSDWIPMQVMP